MVKREKNHITKGLETLLNDPRTCPFTAEGSKTFKEVINASEMPLTEALKYVGKNKKKTRGPTDKERSEARIEKLEENSKEQ